MRLKGVHHVEFSVLDYNASIAFFDRMFGWLGYRSFSTLDIGYRSTYYMARFPLFHSYIGIQPAQSGGTLAFEARPTGIHHIALWARSRRDVDRFHAQFLQPEGVTVSEPPAAYPVYAPGYYAVFFFDPITGIRFELAHTPLLASPRDYLRFYRALKQAWNKHPEWKQPPWRLAVRDLPGRRAQRRD